MLQGSLLIIGGLGYYFYSNNKLAVPTEKVVEQIQENVVPSINPEDIGLSFTARSDGKAVKFIIENAYDIQSLDYEISYTAEGNVPRGAIGHMEKKAGESTIASNYTDLGTCAFGGCKYDIGVSQVKLILKIADNDGKFYVVEKTLEL